MLTPFEALGSHDGIRRIVDRFYDMMDRDPAFAELRALHAADLDPMRLSLSSFLTAWVGGPRDWFAANPDKCMMSVHAGLPISARSADQWVRAMSAALNECDVDADLASRIEAAFSAMASGMVRPS